ncbi:MAG TPA: hypothetical protein VGS22_28260 [Thermoanaerobaculia bacterium]|jgi:hypothetical protein|nr:hypothetical protein [Thermoanaerobaculia bacterium]
MKVKEAANLAKQHIADLFAEEGAQNIGLEEIEFDPNTKTWGVTVGFLRPWNRVDESGFPSITEFIEGNRRRFRDMKVVTINDSNGETLAVRNRE